MEKEDFIEIMFKRILGEIEPVGEIREDNKRYNNFCMYEILLNIIKGELINCSEYRDKNEFSMRAAGNRSYKILKELYGELEYYFKETDK